MTHFRTAALLVPAALFLLAACAEDSSTPASPEAGSAPAAAAGGADEGDNLATLLAQADVKRGQTLFLQCRACHSLEAGEPHKVGPNLHGMFGRQAGIAPGFDYSPALQEADVVWTPEALDEWLERPSEYLPGNRMVFIGVKQPADRANLIAYLQQATAAE
ncbi:MAG: cytochrome c family protein [Chromatiales bacterium]|nr:MAG: cytochrome c family protein [Chromatiales bacterium]